MRAWRVPAVPGAAEEITPPVAGADATFDVAALGDLSGTDGAALWVRVADVTSFRALAESLHPEVRRLLAGLRHDDAAGMRRAFAHVAYLGEDWLLVAAPTVWFTEDDRQVSTGELKCLTGPGVVVTFESGDAQVHEHVLSRLAQAGPPTHDGPVVGAAATGPSLRPAIRVTGTALVALVSRGSQVELELGDAVADVEHTVFGASRSDPTPAIYGLKREISEARRALMPLAAELPELLDGAEGSRIAFDRRVLDRLAASVERIDRHLDAQDDLLSDMLSVHLSRVSVRQNEDMRKISAWAAIIVFPTVVAGIYGMNFTHMPELHWVLGYPLALAVMAAGCTVLFRAFRRAGWL